VIGTRGLIYEHFKKNDSALVFPPYSESETRSRGVEGVELKKKKFEFYEIVPGERERIGSN